MATIAGGVSMKRRDLIRQKNKLAKTGGFRYIRYAKYACVAMVVLFLVYVGGLSNLSGKSYEELISKSPIVITGFMICTANLYVWYVLKHFLKDLAVPQHVESIRVNLLLMTIGQFILMNFISAVLMMLSLRKYFQWNTFSVKNALKEIRKEGQLSVLIVTALVLILFISLVSISLFVSCTAVPGDVGAAVFQFVITLIQRLFKKASE